MWIARWLIDVTKTKVTKSELPFNNRNQAQVRVEVNIDPGATRVTNTPKFQFWDFIEFSGAMSAFMGLGIGVVAWIFYFLEPFGVLGPNDGNAIYDTAANDFDEELRSAKMEQAEAMAAAIKEAHPDMGDIDPELVFEKVMAPSDSAAFRKEADMDSLLAELVKKEGGGAAESSGLPDDVMQMIDAPHSDVVNPVQQATEPLLGGGAASSGPREEV